MFSRDTKGSLKGDKNSSSKFIEWNEEMFKKHRPDKLFHHPNPVIRYIENKRRNTLLKLLNSQKNDEILEVGCGEGNIIEKISAGKIVAMDISRTALNLAKKKLRSRKIEFAIGDAQSLPFREKSFNKTYCTEVLEHVLDPTGVLEEISRVTKNSGAAVVTIPNEPLINKLKTILINMKLFNLFLGEMPKKMDDEWHLHSFDLNLLKKHMAQDLIIVRVKSIPFSFLPLRYVVKCRKKLRTSP